MATEYIGREAALACFSDWIDRYGHEHTADEMVEYQMIEDLPAADVVEVVRCRDCVHLRMTGLGTWCFFHPQGSLGPDDFCSAGERRTP